MLTIDNLSVSINGKEILKGIDLRIKAGEIHAIMGANGSGKTTLVRTIAGLDDNYQVRGRINFLDKNITAMKPEERARKGIFLAWQSPIEVNGVSLYNFIRAALKGINQDREKHSTDTGIFSSLAEEKLKKLGLKKEFLSRGVNEGLSGGEKKKSEIFQLQVLQPRLAILDEIDSGLDVDSSKKVAEIIKNMQKNDRAFLIVTHYQRILNYIKPHFVHVMAGGKIVKSGNYKLVLQIEKKGYESLY